MGVQFNFLFKNVFDRSIFLLIIPLILSTFTHLWNPIGFPAFFTDEGTYMRRTMGILDGMPIQESKFYDHPFFGPLFLAGVFSVIGYPNSLHPSADLQSIEMLYLVPRVLMGLLAVADTFLVYKITEYRYNRKVALVASIFFAVMPMSWSMRRVFLDNIMLPFLLSSILFAIYFKYFNNNNRKIPIILISGIFLGLAIFTKIPVVTMIPLVGFLIFTNNSRNLKTLGLWFIPVLLIPLIWPAYSVSVGQFDDWLKSVSAQSNRANNSILNSLVVLYQSDPVLTVLAAAGFVFAAVRRDFFLLLWAIPFVLFFFFIIGRMTFSYWIPLIPFFCVAAAKLTVDLSQRIYYKKIQQILPFAVISGIVIFGLTSTTMLISTNVSSYQQEAAAFVAQHIENSKTANGKDSNSTKDTANNVTIISGPIYSWIFRHVFDQKYVFSNFRDPQPIHTKNIIIMADGFYKSFLRNHQELLKAQRLQVIHENTDTIARFKGKNLDYDYSKYPDYNMRYAKRGGNSVDVRTNF